MQKPSWSHEYHWFHPCALPEMILQICAAHAISENPSIKTPLLNSLVGYRIWRIVEEMMNITSSLPAIAANMILLCIVFHGCVTRFRNSYHRNCTEHEMWTTVWRIQTMFWNKREAEMLFKALINGCLESHLLLKCANCLWNSFYSQTTGLRQLTSNFHERCCGWRNNRWGDRWCNSMQRILQTKASNLHTTIQHTVRFQKDSMTQRCSVTASSVEGQLVNFRAPEIAIYLLYYFTTKVFHETWTIEKEGIWNPWCWTCLLYASCLLSQWWAR